MPEGLQLRKLAEPDGDRVAVTHPVTGERNLYTPEDAATLRQRLAEAFDGITPTPYPFLGIQIENPDGAPVETQLTPRMVEQGRAEGWLTTTPEEVQPVVRSSGPKENPWAGAPHVFHHYETITLHLADGSASVYEVVENPDKWPEEKGPNSSGFGGEVRHFYELRLSGVHEPEAAAVPEGEDPAPAGGLS